MTGLLSLGGVMLAGFAFLLLMLVFMVVFVKAAFWLVLLPFRLLFWALGAVVMLVGGLALILTPLLPLVILGALVYGLVRLIRRPAVA
ncbi:MAG: hypothetical protein EXQ49_11630 [Acidobacteria bacterium]|nr:hypothetical protein [Acidobacteriota bacterium]